MPMASSSRRWRTSWASHPNASTSKRWNRPTSPAVQSERCMLTTPMPGLGQLGRVALQRDVDVAAADRVDEVRLGRQRARASRAAAVFDEHSHRRWVAPAAGRHLHQRLPGGGVVDVERQLVVGAQLGVQVGRGGARRARPARRPCSAPPACAASPGGRRPRGPAPPRRRRSAGRRTRAPGPPAPAPGGRPARVFSGSSALAPRWAKVIGAVTDRLLPTSHSRRRILKCPRPAADACRQVGHE